MTNKNSDKSTVKQNQQFTRDEVVKNQSVDKDITASRPRKSNISSKDPK